MTQLFPSVTGNQSVAWLKVVVRFATKEQACHVYRIL